MEAPDWSFTWSRPRFASAVSGRPPPCPSGWHWSSWNHHSSSHLWPQWPRSWIYQEQGPQNEHSVHPVSKHVIKIYNKISVKMKYQRITIFLCIWFPFMLFITLSISVPSLCPSFSLSSGVSLFWHLSLSLSLSLSHTHSINPHQSALPWVQRGWQGRDLELELELRVKFVRVRLLRRRQRNGRGTCCQGK